MDTETRLSRLEFIKAKHKKQHAIVEALEADKAPEETIAKASLPEIRINPIAPIQFAVESAQIVSLFLPM